MTKNRATGEGKTSQKPPPRLCGGKKARAMDRGEAVAPRNMYTRARAARAAHVVAMHLNSAAAPIAIPAAANAARAGGSFAKTAVYASFIAS